jgi:hypothetical protein
MQNSGNTRNNDAIISRAQRTRDRTRSRITGNYAPKFITVENRRFQCAGVNRHEAEEEEALRERVSDPLGLESCAATARDPAKRRQRYRRGGYSAPKTVNPDADDFVMRGRQHGQER